MKDQNLSAGHSAKNTELVLKVNGRRHRLELGRDLEASDSLAKVLRENLGLTGLKIACNEGGCGACTVLMDGRAVLSCMTLAVDATKVDIRTVEGLEGDDPVVEAMAGQSEPGYGTGLQCGYCTPGFVMAIKGLLTENPTPTLDEVKEGLSGNLCRCGCYSAIGQAALHAAEETRKREGSGE